MDKVHYILESAVVVYLVKEVWTYWKTRQEEKRNEKSFQKAFIDIAKLYEQLNGLLVSTDCDRVLLLRSHNGGGKPKLGSPLYSTAEYEVFKGQIGMIKPDWQSQPLDEHYIKMLKTLDDVGSIELPLYGMEPTSMLKKLYFANRIHSSKIIKIHENKDSFFYLSINYTRSVDFIDENFDERARPYITRIQNLFKDGEK